ncbi:hypothetical protein Tco_0959730, partial [Tanacetum coccineum]
KQCFEIQKKQFLIENDRLLDQIISQDIVNIVVNSSLDINTSVNVNSSAAMNDSVNYVEMCNKCPELKHSSPATLSRTRSIFSKPSEKLVVVTPINKKKTVRFAEPVISSSTSQKQLGSSQIKTKQTTNNSVSTSTGVSRSTKSSRSKSTNNTKNDRILQISSSTKKKNKVEDHSRIIKSCLNKTNCVIEPSGNAHVQHSKLNTNSELMCVKYNSSMFDVRHELCFLEFVSDMNACSKSKAVKKAKKQYEWKPTGKVITAINKVSLREPIPLEVVAQESVVTKLYTRRPKVPKTNGSNNEPKIAKSMISNKTEPDTSRGSNTSVALSSSFVDLSFSVQSSSNDQIAKIMRYGDYQLGNITISRVYYVEGLGHNLFFVGSFCDSDLEVVLRIRAFYNLMLLVQVCVAAED